MSNKTIIRTAKHRDNPYVMVDKYAINDPNISFKAKGLLVYLLSKPDNWIIRIEDLSKHSIDGRTSIASALRELISAGYVIKNKLRKSNGRFLGIEYVVYERPQDEIYPQHYPQKSETYPQKSETYPQNKYTRSANIAPEAGFPLTENQPLLNNNNNNLNISTARVQKKLGPSRTGPVQIYNWLDNDD